MHVNGFMNETVPISF